MDLYWSPLLSQSPYLLLAFLLPMLIARMQLGPKARAMLLEDLPRWAPTRLLVLAWFWTSNKVFFFIPYFGEIFERWDEQSRERRAQRTASSTPASSSAHRHAMTLDRLDSVIIARCSGCALSAPIRPPRSAQRNVAALERWLDRLDRRLLQDSQA